MKFYIIMRLEGDFPTGKDDTTFEVSERTYDSAYEFLVSRYKSVKK